MTREVSREVDRHFVWREIGRLYCYPKLTAPSREGADYALALARDDASEDSKRVFNAGRDVPCVKIPPRYAP